MRTNADDDDVRYSSAELTYTIGIYHMNEERDRNALDYLEEAISDLQRLYHGRSAASVIDTERMRYQRLLSKAMLDKAQAYHNEFDIDETSVSLQELQTALDLYKDGLELETPDARAMNEAARKRYVRLQGEVEERKKCSAIVALNFNAPAPPQAPPALTPAPAQAAAPAALLLPPAATAPGAPPTSPRPATVPERLTRLEALLFAPGEPGPSQPMPRLKRLDEILGTTNGTLLERLAALEASADGMGL